MTVATCICCGRTAQTHFDEVCERSAVAIELRVRHLFGLGWTVNVYGDWVCLACDSKPLRVPHSPTRARA